MAVGKGIEQGLEIGRAPRTLEAVLALPQAAPVGAAVVCHPHPQYGGDMQSGVVIAVARALVAAGHAALRFNFGGVGRSGGGYTGGPGEMADAGVALEAMRARVPGGTPVALVGYSFGAWIALRVAAEVAPVDVVAVAPPLNLLDCTFPADRVDVVVGEFDQYCSLEGVRKRSGAGLAVIAGADHFFAGREHEVASAVVEALTRSPR
jgi:alpha/beta superfamily hydrolase